MAGAVHHVVASVFWKEAIERCPHQRAALWIDKVSTDLGQHHCEDPISFISEEDSSSPHPGLPLLEPSHNLLCFICPHQLLLLPLLRQIHLDRWIPWGIIDLRWPDVRSQYWGKPRGLAPQAPPMIHFQEWMLEIILRLTERTNNSI